MSDLGDFLIWLIVGGIIGGILITAWPVLVVICTIIIAYYCYKYVDSRLQEESRRYHRRIDGLIARADAQHAAIMRGDEYAGTYGKYPPAV